MDLVKYIENLRSNGYTWSQISDDYYDQTGIMKTSNAMRKAYEHAKKRKLDLGNKLVDDSKAELEKELDRLNEEKSVDFETGEIVATTTIEGDATKMTPDDILNKLGYAPEVWKLRSLKVKSWDQVKKGGTDTEKLSSVRYILAPKNPELSINDAVEIAKEVFSKSDIPTKVKKKSVDTNRFDKNKLLLVNQIELHLGKISESEDTGVNYNTEIALDRFDKIVGEVIAFQSVNKCGQALVVIGGDFFNSESDGHTFNKTPIQNDHRYKYLFKKGLTAYKEFIDALMQYVPSITVMLCEGNHARSMEFYLYEALKNHYDNILEVEFIDDYKSTQCRVFGNNALFFNHGDVDMKRLVSSLPGEFNKEWGLTDNHYLFIGHFHKSEVSNTENGLQWIRIPAPCSNDEWTTRNRFGAGTRPSYQLMTFDDMDGLDLSRFIYFDEVV